MSLKLPLIIILSFLLSACSKNDYVKSGVSSSQMYSDKSRCESDARRLSPHDDNMPPVETPTTTLHRGTVASSSGSVYTVSGVSRTIPNNSAQLNHGARNLGAKIKRTRLYNECMERIGYTERGKVNTAPSKVYGFNARAELGHNIQISQDDTVLYSQPSYRSIQRSIANKGDVVEVLDVVEGWYKVSNQVDEGWVRSIWTSN